MAFKDARRTDFEIIVCDNNSTDATSSVARQLGARVVFEEHNQISRARNRAAEAALGEWFIFIDADSILPSRLLAESLSAIATGGIIGGGAKVALDSKDVPAYIHMGLALWNTLSRVMRWAAGSYIFCSREAFSASGGFDENLYASEEITFSRALKRLARRQGKRFLILRKSPVITSARKARHYSFAQTIWQVLVCAWPGSLRRRDRCGFWYQRSPTNKS